MNLTTLQRRALALTDRQWALILFGLALTFQLVFVFVGFALLADTLTLTVDPDQYGVLGRNWADGYGLTFLRGDAPTTYRGPGYPFMLAVVYQVFGASGMQPVTALLQALCGAGTVAAIFFTGRRIFGRTVGVLAGFVGLIHPLLVWYAPRYRYEPLFTLCFTLAILFTLRLWDDRRWQDGLLAGLCFGLAALVSQVAMLAPVGLFAIMLLWPQQGRRALLVPLGIGLAVMVLVILPWTARNYQLTGRIIPVQEGSMTQLFKGNIEYDRYEEAPMQSVVLAELAADDMAAILDVDPATFDLRSPGLDATFGPLALDYLREQPLHFAGKVITQAARFWFLSETPRKSIMLLVLQVAYLLPAAVGLAAGLRRAEARAPVFLLLATIGYVNLLYAATHVEARYSTPVVPLVVVLTAAGLWTLYQFLARRRAATRRSES